MVELTREDWTRLTTLIHGYGSVAALEHALGPSARQAAAALPNPVDLADMVRVEVAHHLVGSRGAGDPKQEPGVERAGSPITSALWRRLHLLWPVSGIAWISLGLILIADVSPLRAAVTGILAVLGFQLGRRRDGRIRWWLWQAIAAGCVITWAVASSWPIEASALVLGSVLAGCFEPLRSTLIPRAARDPLE
jgi:hypothetical protein